MEILTSKITVNKDTPIEYALYDAYGIDVKAAYPGTVTSDEKVTVIKNGYVKDLKIYMNTVGQTGIVKLDYTSTENKNLILTATTTVTCVALLKISVINALCASISMSSGAF